MAGIERHAAFPTYQKRRQATIAKTIMRQSNTEKIGDLIRQFMRINGIETPYNQHLIIEAWPVVMGKMIQKYTGEIFIKNQNLHVQITSPAIKQNLMMEHRAIARRLNEHVGAQVIEDVVFY